MSALSPTSALGKNFSDTLNDDVDDFAFLSHPRQGSSGYMLGNHESQAWEDKRRQLLDERKEIEERTLQSSKVALGLLYESEQVGIGTAEELVKQREQLNNVEEKLDTINSTMRISQKHLNGMKSMFGGIRNYFSKSSTSDNNANAISSRPNINRESDLAKTIGSIREESISRSANNHPALAHRGIDFSGFRLDDDEEQEQVKAADNQRQQNVASSGRARKSDMLEKQLENNLNEIDLGVGRLKHLALGLGSEIETQNEMLERIGTKTERAEDTVQYQNRQMRKILK